MTYYSHHKWEMTKNCIVNIRISCWSCDLRAYVLLNRSIIVTFPLDLNSDITHLQWLFLANLWARQIVCQGMTTFKLVVFKLQSPYSHHAKIISDIFSEIDECLDEINIFRQEKAKRCDINVSSHWLKNVHSWSEVTDRNWSVFGIYADFLYSDLTLEHVKSQCYGKSRK